MVTIVEEPLKFILPCADCFVTSFSSTVRWAALLQIPTVVVDYGWHTNYDFYNDLPTVTIVREESAFFGKLEAALANFKGKVNLNPDSNSDGVPFDGQATKRIVSCVEEFAKKI